MSLPLILFDTDTFNDWFDATNDLISYAGNSSHLLLVAQNATPQVSTGNVSMNGTFTTTSLNVTGSLTINSTNVSVTSTLSVANSTIFGESATVLFGARTQFSSAANAEFQGRIVATSNTTTLKTLAVNETATINIASVATGNFANLTTSSTTLLGGVFGWANTNVLTWPDNGTQTSFGNTPANTAVQTAAVIRCTLPTDNLTINQIYVANTELNRQLTIVNASTLNNIIIKHGLTSPNNSHAIYCTGAADLTIPPYGAVTFLYDSTGKQWRTVGVLGSGGLQLATTTQSGIVSTTTQSFAGVKTFTANVVVSGAGVQFVGSGLGLTSLNATAITSGTLDAARLPATGINASAISTGTLSIARLSAATISGVSLGGSLAALSNGSFLVWSAGANYTGAAAATLAVDAATAATASKIVARDANADIYGNIFVSSGGWSFNSASSPARVWGSDNTTGAMRTYQTGSLSVGYATSAGSVTNGVYTVGAQSIGGVKTFTSQPVFSAGIRSDSTVLVADGSPTVPSFSFTNHTDCGFYYNTGGADAFTTAGHERVEYGADYNSSSSNRSVLRLFRVGGPRADFLLGSSMPLRISETQVRPGADDVTSLGAAGYRWAEIYAGLPDSTSDPESKTAQLVAGASGRLYYTASSGRYKTNIADLETVFRAEEWLKVVPRVYNLKVAPEGTKEIGFIAEELHDLGLTPVVCYKDGQPDSIRYDLAVVYLTALVKQQHDTLTTQQAQIDALTARLDALESR